ncbi:hypothetical protein H2201_003843 [Coniosporium apollinis]|uniref:Uncharacterized protein n=1 Tax=Coniosporium apollinis TaxID=61459 RepID=A0ABQ9NUS2_9PEZI|nr:hypothetical protein H2201_003843 [Coniosporium apollinis]
MQDTPTIDDEFTPLPSPRTTPSARCNYEAEVEDTRSATMTWNHAVTDTTPSLYAGNVVKATLLLHSPSFPEAHSNDLCTYLNPEINIRVFRKEFRAAKTAAPGASGITKRESTGLEADEPKRPRVRITDQAALADAEEKCIWDGLHEVMAKWDRSFHVTDQVVRDIANADLLHHLSQGFLEGKFLDKVERRRRKASVSDEDMEM